MEIFWFKLEFSLQSLMLDHFRGSPPGTRRAGWAGAPLTVSRQRLPACPRWSRIHPRPSPPGQPCPPLNSLSAAEQHDGPGRDRQFNITAWKARRLSVRLLHPLINSTNAMSVHYMACILLGTEDLTME